MEVRVLSETVAVLAGATAQGDGLDRSKEVARVTLLSLEDGSVVAELEAPAVPVGVTLLFREDEWDRQPVLITEDGQKSQLPSADIGHVQVIAGSPIWGEFTLTTETWHDEEREGATVRMVDDDRGRFLVDDRGPTEGLNASVIDIRTGEVVFDIRCDPIQRVAPANVRPGRSWDITTTVVMVRDTQRGAVVAALIVPPPRPRRPDAARARGRARR